MDFDIKTFLDKFREKIFQKEEIYITIAQIIYEETKFEINKKQITLKDDCIYVKASPAFKNEILIHQNKIINKINNLKTGRVFHYIR